MIEQTLGEVPQTRAKWRAVTGLFAALLLLSGLVWILKSMSLSPDAPREVEFLQFTNSPAGDRYAVFSIHNPYDDNLHVLGRTFLTPDIWWNGRWRPWIGGTNSLPWRVVIASDASLSVEVEIPFKVISDESELGEFSYGRTPFDENRIGFVPRPGIEGLYLRLPVFVEYPPGRMEKFRYVMTNNWENLRQRRSLSFSARLPYTLSLSVSPIITNIFSEP